jgi:hypothetical protein
LARCERGNTDARLVCQAVFQKKWHALVFICGFTISKGVETGRKSPRKQEFQPLPERRYRLDQARGRLVLGRFEIPVPRSKAGRIATGTVLVGGGFLGFLPILGFWMVPLGLVVLSHDLSFVRRRRRRATVWWYRRNKAPRGDGQA